MTVTILGVAPTPPAPSPPPAPILPSYGNMTLRSSRGVVLLTGAVEALLGWEGFDPVRRRPVRSQALGRDGEIRNRFRPFTRGAREIVGPCHVAGDTPEARARLMNRVIDICTPLDDTEVELTLNALGEPVTVKGDVLFPGGGAFSALAAYDTSAVVQFTMSCADPKFYGPRRSRRQVAPSGAAFFPIFPLTLSNSTGFGIPLPLEVGGSLKTYPTVVVSGPATTVRYSSPTTGQAWQLDLTDEPLLGGEQVTVRMDPASGLAGQYRVEGPGGASYWQYLTERAFFPLQPGSDQVLIEVTGDGPGTDVVLDWAPAQEAVS